MQWSTENYPQAMVNLAPDVRERAIERANAWLDKGYRPGRAISLGIAEARDANRGNGSTAGPSPNLNVVPEMDRWVICPADSDEATHSFSTLDQAMRRAHELAAMTHSGVYVFGADGSMLEKNEDFVPDDTPTVLHVTPHDEGWALIELGADEPVGVHPNKRAAVSAGRDRAKESAGLLVLHYASGQVQKEIDYTDAH